MNYIGLFGGSFNPVHVGHLRLAIEVLEYTNLPYAVERVDLIPCAHPAHKEPRDLLPFSLRYDMLKACCDSIDGLHVSSIEQEREGTSYTWHTLQEYAQKNPQHRLLFMEGIENLCDIASWYHGLELPLWADFGVVPRAGGDKELFVHTVKQHWPHAHIHDEKQFYASILLEGQERYIFYMPLPRMDISASYIREKWRAGGRLHALMPQAARCILEKTPHHIERFWK